MDQDKNTLIRIAIGQMASLGELYDARTDTFCAISALKIAPEKSGAVTIQDNPSIDLQYIHTDTFSDKFDKLEIKAGLKVSILAGLFQLEGSGRYLADTKKSARAVRSSLLYNIQTKAERLNLFSDKLAECFALDALQATAATHVVVGVDWGANSMITMEYSNSENKDVKEIEGAIQGELKMFAANISGKASGDYGNGQDSKQTNYSLHIFGDIMPTDEPLPQTIEESLALMKRMPLLVQTANGGKGKPLKYTLVPLSTLASRLSLPKMADKVIKYIDEQAIVRCVQLFDRIAASKQRLYDLYDFVNSNKYCVPADRVRGIGARKDQLDSDEASLRSKLAVLLVEVRSGRAGGDKLEKLISDTNEGSLSENKIQNFINSNEDIADKITYAKMLQHEGVIYVGAPGHGQSLETAKMERLQSEIYILFWASLSSDTKDRDWTDNKHHFLRLAKQNNDLATDRKKDTTRFIAADLDMRPELNDQEHVSSGTRICLFKNGKYIHQNILLDYITNYDRCLIKPTESVHLVVHKPNKHKDLAKLLEKLRPMKEMNILILGETGVGKSTWINGLVNYMTFKSLDDAEQNKSLSLIASSFTITDENYKQVKIKIGDDKNEVMAAGQSATQEPKAYVLDWGKKHVRLIDTPGIGDTRGLDQDKENFDAILRYISNLDELHGICILLKPNNARLTVMFQFCVKELLTHLHKSASNNIVFCFTNARSTFYR
ncbi:unnamed protein product [Oppiella nova]|uniref:G domain-containing protein n=1 Tax=Oppiella nova TaxID=334625 RepID=A0A7R9M9I1_9ACAR|nr:unnamed protein product [Oppiella nova]CAG2172750.1 unnamed protein product [Oppiella nova]